MKDNRRTRGLIPQEDNLVEGSELTQNTLKNEVIKTTNHTYKVYDADEYYAKYKPELSDLEQEQDFEEIALKTMFGLKGQDAWLGELKQWAEIDKEFPNSTRVLVCDGELVGYYFYLFIKKEYFEKIKKGILTDADITLEKVDTSSMPGEYFCYFVDMAIFQKHRHLGFGAKQLLDDFAERLEEYINGEMYVSEVCTVAFTQNGEDMCVHLGLKKENVNKNKNIYTLKLLPFPQTGFLSKRYPKLKELYDDKFSSMQL